MGWGWRGPWPGKGPWSWLPPWMRPGWRWWYWALRHAPPYPPVDELSVLEEYKRFLEEELEYVKRRIEELKRGSTGT